MKKLSNKGFTLVELIIVIAILAIIMLIAIPNFSGILARQEVNADRNTAANIGKAIRIWYTQYDSDPMFKSSVDTAVGKDGSTVKVLPIAKSDEEVDMIKLSELALAEENIDPSYTPSSLKDENGAEEENQYYYIGLVGNGAYGKIVVCISNEVVPSLPKFAATGDNAGKTVDAEGDVLELDALYDGKTPVSGENVTFTSALAYIES